MTSVDAWVLWLVAAGALGVAEIFTVSLVFLMLAGGAVAAGLVDLAVPGAGLSVQVVAFVVVSVALLAVVRPVARRHLYHSPEIRTGVAALEGAQALVLERVDAQDGRVKLAGEVWSARSYDGQAVLEPGRSVDVIKIEGATALVL
ncbi:MAG: NfeD family protein [Carbonactinosporaceae bacterium]